MIIGDRCVINKNNGCRQYLSKISYDYLMYCFQKFGYGVVDSIQHSGITVKIGGDRFLLEADDLIKIPRTYKDLIDIPLAERLDSFCNIR